MTLDLFPLDLIATLVAGGAVMVGLVVGGALLVRRRTRAQVFLALFLVAGGLTLLNELFGNLALYRLHPSVAEVPRCLAAGEAERLTLPHTSPIIDISLIGARPAETDPDQGVVPDILVQPSVEDVVADRDPGLDAVLAILAAQEP